MRYTRALGVGAAVISLAGCSSDGLTSPSVLSYSATSRVVPNPYVNVPVPAIETVVSIRNETSVTLSFVAGNCGVSGLKVYASAARGTPVWSSFDKPIECSLVGYAPTPLAPGESRDVVLYANVGDVLSGDKPAGTYQVDAVVSIGGGDIEPDILELPAGSVTLNK